MPTSTSRPSSRRFWPCGVSGASVPIAIRTPASTARRTFAMCTSTTAGPSPAPRSGTGRPPSAAVMTARAAPRVGTSQVPRSSISSMPSSSRKMPCSMDRIPARTAFTIPCAGLGMGHHEDAGCGRLLHQHVELARPEMRVPRVVARAQHAAGRGDLDDVGAHPMQLADLAAHLVRAIHTPDGMPGVTGESGALTPDTSQSSPCPPVWLTIVRLIWIREPGKRPSSRACLTPRSAPAASRTNVMPARSDWPRLRAASK